VSLLLDTSVVSEFVRKRPMRTSWSGLRAWVTRDLATRFAGRVLPIDIPVAARWGALTGDAEKRGGPLPVIDSLIAATALEHRFSVVTRNIADFERCGVPCVNPWDDELD
jgi:predicted nucleic acid-binding protein